MKAAVLYILFCALLHPVHVSVTGIDYDNDNKVFNLFVKVYNDDMERDMKLCPENFSVDDKGFQGWLSKRITIIVNREPLDLKLLSFERDGLELKFFLSAKCRKTPQSVTVSNTIDSRLYEDQANMIMFKCRDIEEGFKLTPVDTLKVFNIK